MKIKKLTLPFIFLAVTLVAYIAATFAFCYKTKPQIATADFPYSITYEYKGEINTVSGVYTCEYAGSHTIHSTHERYWSGDTTFDNPAYPDRPFVIDASEEMSLAIYHHMDPGYFMGDPLHKHYYDKYYDGKIEPDVDYYDYKNDISLDEENYDEVLKSIDFKIIDFTYPEPIENSFSFSGVEYMADNVTIFMAIAFIFLLLCIIFVRRDKTYKYTILDKISIAVNFIIGVITTPFISLICIFADINGAANDFVAQLDYNIPATAIICLGWSIVLRRKGISKTGFFIQFVGAALFAISLVLDTIL